MWFHDHILSIVMFFPLAGAALLLLLPGGNKGLIRLTANLIGFVGFLVSLPLVMWFNADDGATFQFAEKATWIPSIGANYALGIDGISLLLIMLTTALGFLAILCSWSAIDDRVKEYYVFLLILQTGMLGVFMAMDFFLFYVLWEVMLVPMYFLIGIWGGPRKLYAAIKFFLYTLVGSVLMLLGILFLYFWQHGQTGVWTFDIPTLSAMTSIPANYQIWVFLAFFVGFAIKVPMFPFHTWLPDAHVEAPTAGSVILAGVLLKMGTYGFLRFSLPMLPDAARDPRIVTLMVTLSLIGIIYGALVSLMQKDWKKLVAYSSVSHLGFCTLGIFVLNPNGISGSILQQINHGISTGALFLLVGIVYERRHTREIAEFGGLSTVMPVYATLFLIVAMSSLGLPTLNGFIGEFVILQGAFEANKVWAAFGVSGIVLGAAYLLWLYQRTMFGTVENPKNKTLKDVNFRELMTLLPLIAWAFWIGLYPKPFFHILEKPVEKIVRRVRPDYYTANPAALLSKPKDRATLAEAQTPVVVPIVNAAPGAAAKAASGE
jgi:NADH-quinone oxidoreductase subunit M